jgi:UDP-N-acetylglucosamine--N-acetylmuramyl-(pentapeptide) pyrophosphoryl-undecaprenol N-acetylglucosamine transferase
VTDLFLFAGGGSGGHLLPGIAVAEVLRQRTPLARVLFVGSEREIERRIVTEHNCPHVALPLSPLDDLRRRPHRFLWRNCRAIAEAQRLLREQRPRAVIGLGGLASAPVVWAAHRAGVPIVLLEQNAIPGRATCWLSRWAGMVCVTYPECVDRLPRGVPTLLCGNPVRAEIAALLHEPRMIDAESPTLLVLGGSQGADALNAAVLELVRQQRTALAGWTIVHQTGPRQAAAVQAAYATLGQSHVVADFFPNLVEHYRRADIVISRAGATTLAELACAGKPMVLVPYPHAADNHQRANAEAFASQGAAVVVEHAASASDTAAQIGRALSPWQHDATLRQQIGDAARSLARPDAAERVVSLLCETRSSAA